MKQLLKDLGLKLLSLAVVPVAKLGVSLLVKLVNLSERKEDNDFLVELAKGIIAKREKGEV